VRKVETDLAEKLAEADERRRNMEAERIKKLTEQSGHDRIEKVGGGRWLHSVLQRVTTQPAAGAGGAGGAGD
jgi:hypothetical protein